MGEKKCRKCSGQEIILVAIETEGVPIGEMGQCQCCGELIYLKDRITIRYEENVLEELKQIRKSKDEISLDYNDI